MGKVINPHYSDPIAAWATGKKASFDTWLQGQSDKKELTFDEIRAAFPAVADPVSGNAPLSDGSIAEVLKSLGYRVRDDG